MNLQGRATQFLVAGVVFAGIGVTLRYWDALQAQPSLKKLPTSVKPTPKNDSAASPKLVTGKGDPVLVGAGDIAKCDATEDTLTAQILEEIPGTIFTMGDNVYQRGTAEEFQKCYDPAWGSLKARTFPSPGNHDYYTPNAAPYYAYFGTKAGPAGKGYYSYDLGQWHIVSLNSNIDAYKGSEQERWLRADLAAHPKTCTLAYWHHPVFSSGVHGNDPKMKDIWQTLSDMKADVVVNGHDHHYERFAPQTAEGKADQKGLRQFVVGTGGAELRDRMTPKPNSEVRNAQTFGVIKFTLRPKTYDWEFVPIKGQTFKDKGTGNCTT
ncbi:MAG: alkaline phosphatase [Acaryochloridaceae cyanobacterium RU_4_10]|nr:alkaline phosphatase [Acaryochloridaceae cyanobacterium RU_4_10]